MKKGKAAYESGSLTAIVDEVKGVPRIWLRRTLEEFDGLGLSIDDIKDLREIARMLETYELTGPYRRER